MNAPLAAPATPSATPATRPTRATRLIGAGLATLAVLGITSGTAAFSASATAGAGAPTGVSVQVNPAHRALTANTANTANTATTLSSAKKLGNARGTSYLAEVVRGSRHSLVLVARATGKPLRTVASVRSSDQQAFEDADLAPDGTAWVVRKGALLRIDSRGRSKTVKQYVTSVRVSPDGKQVAYAVDSPDANRDRKATLAIRVLTVATGKVATVSAINYPVDENGQPFTEPGFLQVQGWFGATSLIVGAGCCDSGSAAIISATANTPMERWKALEGDHNTYAVGLVGKGSRLKAIVPVPVYAEGKDGLISQIALDVMAISPKNPAGARLFRLKGEVETADVITQILARTKAAPLALGVNTFPYQGAGTVTAAFM